MAVLTPRRGISTITDLALIFGIPELGTPDATSAAHPIGAQRPLEHFEMKHVRHRSNDNT
jgi:hypothetical protein